MTTSSEYFSDSAAVSIIPSASPVVPKKGTTLAKATYGQVWETWPFQREYAGTDSPINHTLDEIIVVGSKAGKGVIARFALTGPNPFLYGTPNSSKMTVNATSGIVSVSNPTGGVGQFKGLT